MKKGYSNPTNLMFVAGIMLVLTLIINFVSVDLGGKPLSQWASDLFGIPVSSLIFPTVIWMLILPFMATGAILMWLLERLMGVREGYGLIIAIAWAGILFNPLYPVYPVLLVFYVAAGLWGPIAFASIFILSVWYWLKTRAYMDETIARAYSTDIKAKQERLIDLEKKISEGKVEDIAKVRQEASEIRTQLKALKKEYEETATQ